MIIFAIKRHPEKKSKFRARTSIPTQIKWSFVKNRKNWVMDEGWQKILRLIFGTFLEVGQPIPNMENNFF